jgi:hypothetical protein
MEMEMEMAMIIAWPAKERRGRGCAQNIEGWQER